MTHLLHTLRRNLVPALVVLALAGALAWRLLAGGSGGPEQPMTAAPKLTTRSVQGATIATPAAWRSLDRSREHATWGTASRTHTVTLAAIEQGEDSIADIVRALAGDASTLAPGAAVVGAPESLDVRDGSRGDTAMLLRLEVPGEDARPLRVVQVWRRDTRAQLDVVATWTSSDGEWPLDPARALPSSRVR